MYEIIIVGGSYAGLSAAMALGRSRRNVLVIDSGKPCNASAIQSHNFLTQDGESPTVIASVGKAQVLAYPTITFIEDFVVSTTGEDGNFQIGCASGKSYFSKKLIFAAGVKDLLPVTPGFKECWGKSIIHCPYCHGYEYVDQPTGILANGEVAFSFGQLIHNWTNKLTIFTNGSSLINKENTLKLGSLGVSIVTDEIVKFDHEDGHLNRVLLNNGISYSLNTFYARVPFEQHCSGILEIGCKLTDEGFVQVDELSKTNIPGIYAAGDCTTLFRSLAGAVASGSKAGAMVNHEIIVQS